MRPVLTIAVVVTHLGCGVAYDARTDSGLAGNAATHDHTTRYSGAESLMMAMQRLGYAVSYDEILSGLPAPAEDGFRTEDLRSCSAEHGVDARVERLTVQELFELDGVVVFRTIDGAFAMADPRERDGRITKYSLQQTAETLDERALTGIFPGDCLVLRVTDPSGGISWSNCLLDRGRIVGENHTEVYEYTVANRGDDPLTLSIDDISCGCTSASITHETIAPGGTSQVIVNLDLSEKRGFFQTYVTVRSSDSRRPMSTLVQQGHAIQPIRVSHERIHFGECAPETAVSSVLYVLDGGDLSLALEPAMDVRLAQEAEGHVAVRASAVRIDGVDSLPEHWPPYMLHRGDYAIELSAERISPRYLAGFAGTLAFTATNADGSRDVELPFTGTYAKDLHVEPRLVVLRDDMEAAQVTLTKKSGGALGALDVDVDDRLDAVTVTPRDDGGAGARVYDVSSNRVALEPSATADATVKFRDTDSGEIVILPILIRR